MVCLGILRQTTAVTFCLHRFCHGCIQKSLRFGKKECPQCRVSCPSHRNLRPDPVFDAIIAAIYPDLEASEQAQDAAIEAFIDAANVTQFAESAMKGARIQAERARERAAQQKRQQEQMRAEAEERRKKAENTAWIRLLPLPPPRVKEGEAPPPPHPAHLTLVKPTIKATKTVTVQLIGLYVRGKLELRAKEEKTADQPTVVSTSTPMDVGADATPMGDGSGEGEGKGAVALGAEGETTTFKVSVWFRWSDMTDVARKVWTQGRPPKPSPTLLPPSPPSAPASFSTSAPASTAAPDAPSPDSTEAASSSLSDPSSASNPPAPVMAATVDAVPTPAPTAAVVPTPLVKRPRERTTPCRYPVWCDGFVGREEWPDFVELASDTTARFLYEHHWDERRANSATASAQYTQLGAGPWKRLTLWYLVEEVDAEGKPVKRRAVSRAGVQPEEKALAVSTMQVAVPSSVGSPSAVSPSSDFEQTMWSPSGATSTAEAPQSLSVFPSLSSSALVS